MMQRLLQCVGGLALLLCCAGCMRLNLNVKVEDDGSATVTEKLGFPADLLELSAASAKDRALLEKSLTKEGAQERMAKMGEGVTLVSHTVTEAVYSGIKFKESTAVYKIPDVNKLQVTPPYPALQRDPKCCLSFLLEPCYKWVENRPDTPGWMALEYRLSMEGSPDKGAAPVMQKGAAAISPAQSEELRVLLPMIAEMWRGLELKVTLEANDLLFSGSPKSRTFGAMPILDRNQSVQTRVIELLNISSENQDLWNRPMMANEDAMVDVLRGDWNGPHITKMLETNVHYTTYLSHSRIPAFSSGGPIWGFRRFILHPSAVQQKRFFEGKSLEGTAEPKTKEPEHASDKK